jgi:hypothetical protein
MFEGKKTTIFYVGLVALGFGINYLCLLVYQIISLSVLYLSSGRPYLSAALLGTSIPQITSTVIFLVIGLYIMNKGIEKQPTPIIQELH